MKIKYEFVTETIEIEVSDEWAEKLKECDRTEYNNVHAETRRHSHLDSDAEYGDWVATEEENPFALIDLYAEASRIWKAISQLSDEQQKLITEVFINGKKKKEYAEEIGISGAAVSQRINTIRKKLKKLL